MEAQLSHRLTGSQQVFMAASELISSSFPVFRHEQLVGDLLIISPRWYVLCARVVHHLTTVTVMLRISVKGRLPLSRGHACQSTA